MSPRIIQIAFIVLVTAAALIGWHLSRPAPLKVAVSISSPTPMTSDQPSSGWTPPQGDPVQRLEQAQTPEQRLEIMGQFMALGHDRNAWMLIAALKDSSQELRMRAVEHAASLEPTLSARVLKEAVLNDAKDIREMGWSLLAPHPLENKVPIIAAAVERGSDAMLEETFTEMGRTPEMPLFEAMLVAALKAPPGTRQTRVLTELQTWLKPGGGPVPTFRSVDQLAQWWTANKVHYDTYMLRMDQ